MKTKGVPPLTQLLWILLTMRMRVSKVKCPVLRLPIIIIIIDIAPITKQLN